MVSTNVKPIEQQGGLLSYLAKLGLGDADLARVFSMLQASPQAPVCVPVSFGRINTERRLSMTTAPQAAGNVSQRD